MTREEAIIQLRLGPGINEDVSEKYNDAVNMAIEALKREDTMLKEIERVVLYGERREGEKAIEALQTGIVHCEECGWWKKQDDSLQGRCAKYKFYPTGRYFCAGGERSEE